MLSCLCVYVILQARVVGKQDLTKTQRTSTGNSMMDNSPLVYVCICIVYLFIAVLNLISVKLSCNELYQTHI